MNTEDKITTYLADETKLYQDWYQLLINNSQESELQPIGFFPSLEELKAMVQKWWLQLCEKNRVLVKTLFCKTPLRSGETACIWWKRIREFSHESRDLIIAIIVDLALARLFHPSHIEVAVTVIVTNHLLDILCEDEDCGQ